MTALTRLPTDTQNALALIKKSVNGFDKIDIWFDDPYPELPLAELLKICSYVNLIPAIKIKYHELWQSKLVLIAPTPEALILLSEATGTRYRTKINRLELALDFSTQSIDDAHEVQKYILSHFLPDRKRYLEPVAFTETTAYFNSSSQVITIYPDDEGKQASGSCCHLEFRFKTLEEVIGIGIATVHDLPFFDHRKFWNHRFQLREFSSLGDLGRLIASNNDVTAPALYKRAKKFIRSNSHNDTHVLHDSVCVVPDISKILRPIDHRHFLPKQHSGSKPKPTTPEITKSRSSVSKQLAEIELTDEQREIIDNFVNSRCERLVVEAVAGSGKTRTLAEIVYRLLEMGIDPARILLLSFSNVAVNTIRERVGNGITVKTFHSFAISLTPASKRPIDFPVMISNGTKMLETVDLGYDYVFVDEFQDMDSLQFRFLKAIIKQVPNFAIFGDSWQSIFGFSGGGAITSPAKELGAVTKHLTKSHRLTHETAAFASVLTSMKITGNAHGLKPLYQKFDTHSDMTTAIARRVKTLLSKGVPASEIAVLTRTNAQQRAIDRALIEIGVHAAPSYLKQLWDSHMQLVLDLAHEMDKRAGSKPAPGDYLEVADLLRRLASKRINDEKGARETFWDGVHTPSFAGRYAVASRLLVRLHPDKTELGHELNRWAALASAFSQVESFQTFLGELIEQPPVSLSTIHDVKGDEFDYVLVAGVTDGNMPLHISSNRDEEKRLLYVAVTRARARVYLFQGPCFKIGIKSKGTIFVKKSPFLTKAALATTKKSAP